MAAWCAVHVPDVSNSWGFATSARKRHVQRYVSGLKQGCSTGDIFECSRMTSIEPMLSDVFLHKIKDHHLSHDAARARCPDRGVKQGSFLHYNCW